MQLVERDGDRCWYCHGRFVAGRRELTVDHVVPRVRGGNDELSNLRLACLECNLRKGEQHEERFLGSDVLLALLRRAARENARLFGSVLPRSAYHHAALRWYGAQRWACRVCHLSSVSGARPAWTVPCMSMRRWPAGADVDG